MKTPELKQPNKEQIKRSVELYNQFSKLLSNLLLLHFCDHPEHIEFAINSLKDATRKIPICAKLFEIPEITNILDPNTTQQLNNNSAYKTYLLTKLPEIASVFTGQTISIVNNAIREKTETSLVASFKPEKI